MNDHRADSHDQWDELAAGHALHALEPDEERTFAAHLRDCDRCAETLREHELVAAQLGSLAHSDDDETAAPPWAGMRSRVIGPDAPAPVTSLHEHRASRSARRILGAAAAVAVLASAGLVGWQVTRHTPSATAQAISACERTAGCSIVRLRASDGSSPGVVLVSEGRATMVPLAMKPPARDRTYVLWQLPRNGKPAAVGAFRTTEATASAPLVTPYRDTAAFAVSLEPAGPMPTQPTDVLAVGSTT